MTYIVAWACNYHVHKRPFLPQATEERRRMYEHIMHRTASGNMLEQQAGGRRHRYEEVKLSTKDTFKLYKTFMGLAEADEGMQVRAGERTDFWFHVCPTRFEAISTNITLIQCSCNFHFPSVRKFPPPKKKYF